MCEGSNIANVTDGDKFLGELEKLREYEKKVRKILKENGFMFHHHGKGDHDIWFKSEVNVKVTVDGKIKSQTNLSIID